MYVGLSMETIQGVRMSKKCVGKITWPKHVNAQSLFWVVKTELKADRASESEEQRKERLDKTRK